MSSSSLCCQSLSSQWHSKRRVDSNCIDDMRCTVAYTQSRIDELYDKMQQNLVFCNRTGRTEDGLLGNAIPR